MCELDLSWKKWANWCYNNNTYLLQMHQCQVAKGRNAFHYRLLETGKQPEFKMQLNITAPFL